MKSKVGRIAALVLSSLVLPAFTQAAGVAAAQWKPVGPWSETVEAVVMDPKNPKILYAATRNGVFKTIDGAETWVRKSKGIDKVHALCLAVDPKTPATLYIGTYSGGVFKSIDGAETWRGLKPTTGMALAVYGRVPVNHVALDPVNPQNLLFTGFYKSTTGGATFAEIGPPSIGSNNIQSITFDPKNPRIVFASGIGELMKTADGGTTWAAVDFGVPSPAHARVVAIHPTSGEVLLGTGYSGLHKSTDGGKTWKAVGQGLKERAAVYAIAWNPSDAHDVYVAANLKVGSEASVWHSTDGGESFTDVGKDLPYEKISSLVLDPGDPKTLYAGTTFSGVFKTTDGGRTWNEKSLGFSSSLHTIRALAAAGPGTLFATAYGAVYRTTDDGQTWRRVRAGIQKGLEYKFLAAGGADKPVAIAGAEQSRIVYSTDGGDTWGDPPRSAPLRCVARDPKDPRGFYLCSDGGGLLHGGDASAWRAVSDESGPTLTAVAVDPQNPQNVFAGSYHGLHRSVNGGKKWKEWKAFEKVKGGVARPAESRRIFALAFDAKNSKTLYVATEEDGVFKSADGGETWTVVGLTGEKLSAFALDPGDAQHLVIGTPDKGVSVSTDGGSTWTNLSTGLPEDEHSKKKEPVVALVFGSGSPAPLYAATADGVYRAP